MLAAVLSKEDFKLREVPKPHIVNDTDVLLKVTACAICMSEVNYAKGYMPVTEPFTAGHEFVGIVEEVGSAVKKLKVGDRVDVADFTYDNECEMCKRGLTGHCLHGQLFGSDKAWGGLDGALAEYVRVPLADVSCVHVPDNVSDESAVLVGDILMTGYSGVQRCNVQPGQVVAIFGLGPVGLSAISAVQTFKPSKIIAIGHRPERLAAAKTLGATDIIDIDSEDVVERVKEICGPDPFYPSGSPFEGFVDCCIDCCGKPSATDQEIKILKVGGIISEIGMPSPDGFTINMHDVNMKNLTIRGGLTDSHYMQELMDKLAAGEINVEPIITHVMPLSEFDAALDMFAHKKDGCIKVVLKP
jgi:alcohol dehydrogenase